MAKPTERAIKRKPCAVIILEALANAKGKPEEGGREFEWFNTPEAAAEHFDKFAAFAKEDTTSYDDVAYLVAEITDTQSDPMALGRVEAFPENDSTKKWVEEVRKDITSTFVTEKKDDDTKKPNVKVRPKKRAGAAAAAKVKKADEAPAPIQQQVDKKERLKARLANKGDAGFVVKKAATDPSPA